MLSLRRPWWLMPLALACTPSPEEPPPADVTAPHVAFLFPDMEAWVADTVRVAVDVSDADRVARVTLFVDGAAVSSRHEPPWSLTWISDHLPDSSRHLLQVEAVDGAGNIGLTEGRAVWVCQNSPPEIRIEWPPPDHWMALENDPRPWSCRAIDPEEGSLPGEQVIWRLDGSVIDAGNSILHPPALPEGPHQLRVTARDRWGRTGSAGRDITAFRYGSGTDPGEVIDAFLNALRARDPDRAVESLADAFRLYPPVPGAPLDAGGVARALTALLSDSGLVSIQVEGVMGPVERFGWRGTQLAKLELHRLAVRLVDTSGSTRHLRASAGRLFLLEGETRWRLLLWRDLHGAAGIGSGGPSLSELLRHAAG